MNNTHCHKKLIFLSLLMCVLTSAFASQDEPLHPSCVDSALQKDRLPQSIDIQNCGAKFAKLTVKDYLGLVYYDRAAGPFGELRGGFGYERLQIGDRVLFRTVDHAGGSGVFSGLLLAREQTQSGSRLLTDLRRFGAGDRCNGDIAWIGQGEDAFFAAFSLTPASIPLVLAAPQGQLHLSDQVHARAAYAFDRRLIKQLQSCPTCCLGQAVYKLTANNQWRLDYLELDPVPSDTDGALGGLYARLNKAGEVSAEGLLTVDGASVGALVDTLLRQHPSPADTQRLQFWLHTLGFYWIDSVDGVYGPRTRAALAAYVDHHGIEPADPQGKPGLSRQQINTLVKRGLQARGSRIRPVDETGRDASFQQFMTRLRAAVSARDVEAVVALAKPGISLGFSGSGHEVLRRNLEYEAYWSDLETMLSLGAVRSGSNTYCLPYTMCLSLRDRIADYDPYATIIVTDPGARLLAAPLASAKTRQSLDYDILTVERDRDLQSDAFLKVRHASGQTGYVHMQHIAWTVGRFMEVVRWGDGWRISGIDEID